MEPSKIQSILAKSPKNIDINHCEWVYKQITGPDGKLKEQFHNLMPYLKANPADIEDL